MKMAMTTRREKGRKQNATVGQSQWSTNPLLKTLTNLQAIIKPYYLNLGIHSNRVTNILIEEQTEFKVNVSDLSV